MPPPPKPTNAQKPCLYSVAKCLIKVLWYHRKSTIQEQKGTSYLEKQWLGRISSKFCFDKKQKLPEAYMSYESSYTVFLKWHNYKNRQPTSGYCGFRRKGVRGGGMEGRRHDCERWAWGVLEVMHGFWSWFSRLCCLLALQEATIGRGCAKGTQHHFYFINSY